MAAKVVDAASKAGESAANASYVVETVASYATISPSTSPLKNQTAATRTVDKKTLKDMTKEDWRVFCEDCNTINQKKDQKNSINVDCQKVNMNASLLGSLLKTKVNTYQVSTMCSDEVYTAGVQRSGLNFTVKIYPTPCSQAARRNVATNFGQLVNDDFIAEIVGGDRFTVEVLHLLESTK